MTQIKHAHRAVLVLGMHRSGTSAVARVLNLLGADLGSHLLPAASDNPRGFWEHSGVVEIHESLLSAFGRSWHDLQPLPENWLNHPATAEARAHLLDLLRAEFAGVPFWAVKDPRLCRLLPLWFEVLDEFGVTPLPLLVVRHPEEVARSLYERDGFALEQTRLSWLQYTAEAEFGTRGLRRGAVRYGDLLHDWKSVSSRISQVLQLDWPRKPEDVCASVEEFLSAGCRHHIAGTAEDRALPNLVRRMYEAACAWALDQKDWRGVAAVTDEYRMAADTFMQGFGAAVEHGMAEVASRADRAIEDLQKERETLVTTLRGLASYAQQMAAAESGVASPPLEDFAQLYWRGADESYGEDRSVKIRYTGSHDLMRFNFNLPEGARPDCVRFDPSMFPGQFEVAGLRLNGEPVDHIGEHVCGVRQHRLAGRGASQVRLVSFDGDAQLELNLRDSLPAGGGPLLLELMCRREATSSEQRDLIENTVNSGMTSVVQTLSAVVEAALEQSREERVILQQRIEQTYMHTREVSARLGQFLERLQAIRDRVEQSASESTSSANRITGKIDRLETKLREIEEERQRTFLRRLRTHFAKPPQGG